MYSYKLMTEDDLISD